MTQSFSNGVKAIALSVAVVGMSLVLTGCQQNVVYQRSMAELNEKAEALMASGDIDGAVSRLEAAHDLQPDEPNTTYNLAIAYQTQGSYDKAIPLLKQLVEKSQLDKAQVQKTLGITYEAKADQLAFKASEAESDPKADKAKIPSMKAEAQQAYELAIESYQQALPGLKNAAEVEKQIEALQARLKKTQASAGADSESSATANP
ncbi:tetratricopeptide repeat protein [Vampirovibrio chlorellavorus]|uniref:tetratricopeptide repeat protein n=1 Tax=Vampirovibrio chlorellavorus TaxID=758823 RepID=UPI0026F1F19D|nr:tetratricopeptide repeat protein [Vampirovibrio chlorellavorus]